MRIINGKILDYEGLIVNYIPTGRKRRPAIAMRANTVTIHNTGVHNVKANNFMRGCHDISQDTTVSYHFVIDDKEVIQLLPINEVAWHAGNKAGNMTSIAIEICEVEGAEENAIQFIAELLKTLNMNAYSLRTHKFWSGKNCPRLILPKWSDFIIKVSDKMNEVKQTEIVLNGKIKKVDTVLKDGFNYIKLRDLQDDKIAIGYDAVMKRPIVAVKG